MLFCSSFRVCFIIGIGQRLFLYYLLAVCTLYLKFSGNLNAAGDFNFSVLQRNLLLDSGDPYFSLSQQSLWRWDSGSQQHHWSLCALLCASSLAALFSVDCALQPPSNRTVEFNGFSPTSVS